ncbi:uncharacterized protein EAF01_011144 [Botrytis porri]|uniref:uncharacterized protein n=1 Tax=Botrytis porri TaxID=87229 RepID=UPI0019025741|nr:uncharacterized protein EAF01_011144 [Botrytis porri]KAF7887990.1 hypothetical protein EAF01_011144 [Botrytis porri]
MIPHVLTLTLPGITQSPRYRLTDIHLLLSSLNVVNNNKNFHSLRYSPVFGMTALGGLTYDIRDPWTHTTARYIARGFYDLPFTLKHRPAFMNENAILFDEEKALFRDTKDRDYYFRSLELIPGFPLREFQGASTFKDNADNPNTSHHSITQSLLESIKLAPPEIRTNIFTQIPTKRVAGDDDFDSFTKGTSNEDRYLESRDAEIKIPPNNAFFERDFAVHTDITSSEDKEKTMGIVYIENDYPNCFARSYVDFIRFAASLAHSEGFYFERDSSDSNSGIWKSESRESSLLREFLTWFWKFFGVNFTNELEASFAWSKVNHAKFRYLQNISLDILVMEPFNHAQKYVDGRRLKLFLKELHHFPNIESFTVFLQIGEQDLADLMHSPGAYRWANALREITFAKYFDVQFQMLDGMLPKGPIFHAVFRKRLRQLLMPECLCFGSTDDVPDHLGIREMFDMEE